MQKRILIINGHEYYQHSKGNLNMTLFHEMVHLLSANYEVQTTILQEGFNKDEEQNKMKWANVVIYQTPIYNYNVPALFKKYMDETQEHGVYFQGSANDYGLDKGLLTDKSYMFSTTWNAPSDAFNDRDQFFEGRNVDDVLFPLYLIHKYAGMNALDTFSCFDVKKNPDIDLYLDSLKNHLAKYFML